MDSKLFKQFCSIAYDKAGIYLKPGKESLVAARVAKRQRALGIQSPQDYLALLERDDAGEELVHFLDAISTNFTSFFREADHFDLLADKVAEWVSTGQSRLRIWSAASSTGEEPYSIVITALEAIGKQRVDFKLLATDISTQVLMKARAGRYADERVRSIHRQWIARYFRRVDPGPDGAGYEVRPEFRSYVVFKRLNLSTPPYPMNGPLDVIFCRNVMMYFDNAVRQRLVAEAERLLRPGGIFFTGHAETLTGISTTLSALRPSVYVKAEPGRGHKPLKHKAAVGSSS